MPFQFAHSKSNGHFRGKHAKNNLLDAFQWYLEAKRGYNLQYLQEISQNKYFMRVRDLQFYGIGPHWYRPYFPTTADLIGAVLKRHQVELQSGNGNTNALRQALKDAGVDPEICHVPSCTRRAQMHHMFPKAMRTYVSWDIHATHNIIPLDEALRAEGISSHSKDSA